MTSTTQLPDDMTLTPRLVQVSPPFPTAQEPAPAFADAHSMTFCDVTWTLKQSTSGDALSEDGLSYTASLSVDRGKAEHVGLALDLHISTWSRDHYVLLPGAVYNGNRFRSLAMWYPPFLYDPVDHRADLPVTITDVPRLNDASGPSRIEQTTADPATPAICVYDPHTQRGLILLTAPFTRLGLSGLTVQESPNRSAATLTVTAPTMRTRRQGFCENHPSDDDGASWTPGDNLDLPLKIYLFDCHSVQDLFDRFFTLRMATARTAALSAELPLSHALTLITEKHNRDNWREDRGYYAVDTREHAEVDWQLGWVGGAQTTIGMLYVEDALTRQRCLTTLDTILTKSQAPYGLFHGSGRAPNWIGDSFGNEPHPKHMSLIRKNADGLFVFLKQFDLLEKQDATWSVPDAWDAAVRRQADAFVTLWNEYGQFGQFINVETGEIVVGGSTSGAMAPGALALAFQRWKNPEYLRVAEAAAKQYYTRDMQRGYTTGGPGEILQCPDSESAFALLDSLVALYETTGKSQWLDRAEAMARQCATWVVNYDFAFPANSLYGRLGMRTTGSVIANVQNKHSAPHICTLSGDSLLRLYRATGDRDYADLLREITRNSTQYVSREDRPIGEMPSGWVNERVNMSDWEKGGIDVGEIFHGSCWPEASIVLSAVEVPGLYAQPDTGYAISFDTIDITTLHHDNAGLHLRLHNPTTFPASVRILAERSETTAQPLPRNPLLGAPMCHVDAGGACEIRFLPDATVDCGPAHE